jgi:hypothetical protein
VVEIAVIETFVGIDIDADLDVFAELIAHQLVEKL